MKKMLKRNSGFTLIELIVVIAILAILAGVGTVAYSGYINKAHKANDIQLAGDVRYALELAAVTPGTTLGEGGTIVLQYDKAPEYVGNGSTEADKNAAAKTLEAAVEKAFGKDANLKLQYSKWNEEGTGGTTAADILSMISNDVDGAMNSIQSLTTALASLDVTKFDNTGLGAFVDKKSGGNTNADATTKANAATMYVSSLVNKTYVENAEDDALQNLWDLSAPRGKMYIDETKINQIVTNTGEQGTGSLLGNLAVFYASIYTAAKENGNDTIEKYLTDEFAQNIAYNMTYSNMDSTAAVKKELGVLNEKLVNQTFNITNEHSDGLQAFRGAMQAVNEIDGQLTNSDYSSDNLYTGKGTQLVNAYLNGGKELDPNASQIAITCIKNGDTYTISSYPFFD